MRNATAETSWATWTGDERCAPAVRERPACTEAVSDAVQRAARQGHTVRVAGSGHSFTPVVLTDGTLLSLERMDQVIDVDRRRGHVRVQAGITLNALSTHLWDEHGLALENLGDIDVQSVAGATATGTHGTGARLANLSRDRGRPARRRRRQRPRAHRRDATGGDAWRAARVSVGALGVVTELTLQCRARLRPARPRRGGGSRRRVLHDLDARAAAHDHFELFAFPYADKVITRTNDRVDGAAAPRRAGTAWVADELLTNRAFEALVPRWAAAAPP